MAHSARVRNIFDLRIPLSGPPNLESVPLLGANFGFALAEKNNDENNLEYHIRLVYKNPFSGVEISLPNSFVWAKRNAIRFERSPETQEIEEIIVRIKLPSKLFDFRKYKTQQTRIQVSEVKNGRIIKQAFSDVVQILPKNRHAGSDSSVFWEHSIASNVTINHISDPDLYVVAESPVDEVYDHTAYVCNVFHLNYSNGFSIEMQNIGYDNSSEQYMVLYNGNAEVVGNFRALNFYKSSDINIKDDIRLLTEDHDCRDTLLQIDGVNYKFKKGVHPDTNRRFVGYIAQQVESVVPEAVQLIDGILHVDYESLLPYLSDSARSNYSDITDLRSKFDRIQRVIDDIYDQFIIKNSKNEPQVPKINQKKNGQPFSRKKIIVLTVIAVTIISVIFATLMLSGVIPISADSSTEISSEMSPWKEFYLATNGDMWFRSTHWLNEKVPVCKWYGVSCVEKIRYIKDANVTLWTTSIHLSLENNNLRGTLPKSLHKIPNLEVINLHGNSLTGNIPEEFEKIQNLTKLKLSGNLLTGPLPNIEKYTELQEIDLSDNRFYGTIPKDFLQSSNLIEVNLAYNQLYGTIPNAQALKVLDLRGNQITGPLPWLGHQLEYLNLADNMMSGDVFYLTIMNSLKYLNLANNMFSGDTDPITVSPTLEYLNLANNRFHSRFKLLESTVRSIKYIDISNNQLQTWVDTSEFTPNKELLCDASGNSFVCPLGANWMREYCNADCHGQS